MGAKIKGFSLKPDNLKCHFNLLQLKINDSHSDIRVLNSVEECIKSFQPELVFHLAAQPLVRESYKDPYNTFTTNTLGTLNILETCRKTPSVKGVVVVTSDKCYDITNSNSPLVEENKLGGIDPYSSSKATAEIIATSYQRSYSNCLIATARAGNVIGGGDWAKDRLLPDIVKNHKINKISEIRNPNAIRPWQHVLEPLSGYLLIAQRLLEKDISFATSWNLGPSTAEHIPVLKVLEIFKKSFPFSYKVNTTTNDLFEHPKLFLDSSKANNKLDWRPVWNTNTAIKKTAEWYSQFYLKNTCATEEQLNDYIKDAKNLNYKWAINDN